MSSAQLLAAVTNPNAPSLRTQVTELAKRVEQTNHLVTTLDADLRRESSKAVEAGEEAASPVRLGSSPARQAAGMGVTDAVRVAPIAERPSHAR